MELSAFMEWVIGLTLVGLFGWWLKGKIDASREARKTRVTTSTTTGGGTKKGGKLVEK